MYPLRHLIHRKVTKILTMLRRFKNQDETETLFKNFQPQKTQADSVFKKQLRKDILAYNSKQNRNSIFNLNILRSIFLMDNQLYRPLKVATVFSMLVLILTTIGLTGYNYFKGQGVKTTVLSEAQAREVFAQMVTQNPGNIIKENQAQTPSIAKTALAAEDQANPAMYYNPDYNYSHVTNTYTVGPKKSECNFYYDQSSKSEYYQYFETDPLKNEYYTKSMEFDESGNLISYFLNTPQEYIEYHGGDYAISTKAYDQPTPMPLKETSSTNVVETNEVTTEESESITPIEIEIDPLTEDTTEVNGVVNPSEPDQSSSSGSNVGSADGGSGDGATYPVEDQVYNAIDSLFSPTAKVEEIKEDDKVKYYIVTDSYQNWCGGELSEYESLSKSATVTNSDQGNEVTMVTKTWYDANSFEIFQSESYLDSETPENLMFRTETKMDKGNVEFTKVADRFTFDYDVEVKDVPQDEYIDYPYDNEVASQNAYLQKVKTFLNEQNVTLTLPISDEYKFSELYPNKISNTTKFYTDRKFYAPTDDGQNMYDQAVVSYNDFYSKYQVLSIQITSGLTTDYNFNNTVVKVDASEEDLMNNLMYGAKFDQNMNITVNGQAVVAKKYLASETAPDYSKDYMVAETQPEMVSYKSEWLVFDYGNFKHIYFLGTTGDSNREIPTAFTVYSANNESDWVKLETEIRNSFTSHANILPIEPDGTEPGNAEPSNPGDTDY